jgi:hypothetical protein
MPLLPEDPPFVKRARVALKETDFVADAKEAVLRVHRRALQDARNTMAEATFALELAEKRFQASEQTAVRKEKLREVLHQYDKAREELDITQAAVIASKEFQLWKDRTRWDVEDSLNAI